MTEYTEELVKAETVYEGRLLTVRVDTVRLPDGREATRDIVQHPGAVAMVPLIGDEVVMVRQWRQPLARVMLEIPAGTLTPGEAPEDCAARELAEEIGYVPGRLTHLASVGLAPGYSSEVIHIYLAEGLTPHRESPDDDEILTPERLPLAEVARRCAAGEVDDAKTVVGVLMTWMKLGAQAGALNR